MQLHELVCSSFLCLSSSQEFRSACFYFNICMIDKQYIEYCSDQCNGHSVGHCNHLSDTCTLNLAILIEPAGEVCLNI